MSAGLARVAGADLGGKGQLSATHVLDALAEVHDPELDEPITALGFVASCEVTAEGAVAVSLRLPTPQCAPNFAFLMAADARAAVSRLPEVRAVSIRLEDHYTGTEINAALQRGAGFSGAFPGETDDDGLDSLRELFLRKALVARQSRLCESLLAAGASADEVTGRRVADLPDVPDVRRCLELRRTLGLPADGDAPAFMLPDGSVLGPEDLKRWLRTARLVRMSLEVNGGICRSLLKVRHGVVIEDPEEVVR
ncbi:MAG: iron-sulfur cluster assembly protein [Solirubrobacterales bacterium]|nr:iron-sulfur cluster assembly protein [Solirubrobacterales bacterium]